MKSFVGFALFWGALLFVAVEARPVGVGGANKDAEAMEEIFRIYKEQTDAQDAARKAAGADGKKNGGIAGFPLKSLAGDVKMKVQKVVDSFNKCAQDSAAYTAEYVGNAMKVTGNVHVMMKDGTRQFYDTIFIDKANQIRDGSGKVINNAIGIFGGEENRLNNLSKEALDNIKQGFSSSRAFLSVLPDNVWIFGNAAFDQAAMIASNSAKVIKEMSGKFWSAVPLDKADKDDIEKLVKSGIDLAVLPAEILVQGIKNGFVAAEKTVGAIIGTTLAMGSTGASKVSDMVKTSATIVGRNFDRIGGFGRKMAGMKDNTDANK